MDCSICNELFDSKHHIPMVGACGHSVCSGCSGSLGGNCPLCRTRIGQYRRNYQLIAVMDEMKNKGSISSSELLSKSIEKCTSCKTVVEEKKLRICVSCLSDSERDLVTQELPLNSFFMEKMDKSVLCGSCFLEGTHEEHSSIVWLPLKLRQSADALTCGFLKRIDACRRIAERDIKGLLNSIDSLKQIAAGLGEEAKHCDSVAQYEEFVEKCGREMQVIDKVEESMLSQFKEHSNAVNTLKKTLEAFIQRDLTQTPNRATSSVAPKLSPSKLRRQLIFLHLSSLHLRDSSESDFDDDS